MAKSGEPTGPSTRTVKRLFAVSGNKCAFPDCRTPLVDAAGGSVLGEICHIKGEKPGAARYDAAQTNKERQDFDNLILLCGVHHKIIDDNEQVYSVEKLREWKTSQEARWQGVPVDKEHTELFVDHVTSIQQGSIVTSHNQAGGQIAHNITNIYQSSPVLPHPTTNLARGGITSGEITHLGSEKSKGACFPLIDYLDAWYEDRHGRSNSPTVAESPWKEHLDYLDSVWQPGPIFSQLPNELQNRDVVLTCRKLGLLDYGEVGTTPPEAYGEEANWWQCRPLCITKTGRDFAAEVRLSGSPASDSSHRARPPVFDPAHEHGQENREAALPHQLTPECYELLALVADAQELPQIRELPKSLTGDPLTVCDFCGCIEVFHPLIEDAERCAKERPESYVVGSSMRSTLSSPPTHARITRKGRACLAIHRLASKSMPAGAEAKNVRVVEERVVDAISEVYAALDRLFDAASVYIHPAGDKETHFKAYCDAGRAFDDCFFPNRLFMPDSLFQKVNDAYRRLADIERAFTPGRLRIRDLRHTEEDESCWSRAVQSLNDLWPVLDEIRGEFRLFMGLGDPAKPCDLPHTTLTPEA